jgi:hypothetical protein
MSPKAIQVLSLSFLTLPFLLTESCAAVDHRGCAAGWHQDFTTGQCRQDLPDRGITMTCVHTKVIDDGACQGAAKDPVYVENICDRTAHGVTIRDTWPNPSIGDTHEIVHGPFTLQKGEKAFLGCGTDSNGDGHWFHNCKGCDSPAGVVRNPLFLQHPDEILHASIVLAFQANGVGTPIVVPIHDLTYAPSMTKLSAVLNDALRKHFEIPISSLFDEGLLNRMSSLGANSAALEKVLARGPLLFSADTVRNEGKKQLDLKFQDEHVGGIELVLPAHMTAEVTSSSSNALRFVFTQPVVIILAGELVTLHGIPRNQRLDSITFGPDSVDYDLHSGTNKLKVKLALSEASK